MHQKVTNEDLAYWVPILGKMKTAQKFKMTVRQLQRRVYELEGKSGVSLVSPLGPGGSRIKQSQSDHHRIPLTIKDGVVIVFGDAHYWPGDPPIMHRALLKIIKHFRDYKKLRAVIANGDMLDLAAISRWPQVNWEKRPTVINEIECCQDRMQEIVDVSGDAKRIWCAGNHDLRFNNFIAQNASELASVKGIHLKDHFTLWENCWSVLINENTFIKHRIRGGIYAVRNNVLASGLHTITNHLHAAVAFPITNMVGTLWGVDTGCIANVTGAQFLYTEDNPKNWREAFCVLTYNDGELLPPELVLKHESKSDHVIFRGEVIPV